MGLGRDHLNDPEPEVNIPIKIKGGIRMDNLALYEKVRVVPPEAQKEIIGGRLKGMTDINPMWRIKALTEQFGMCGVGWKFEITDKGIIDGAEGTKMAYTEIELRYKHEGEWSEPIPGTGGSMLVAKEKTGLHTNDECLKMALTDAISVACKALGIGADVYWQKDKTKYNGFDPECEITPDDIPEIAKEIFKTDVVKSECEQCQANMTQAQMAYSKQHYDGRVLCKNCQKEAK